VSQLTDEAGNVVMATCVWATGAQRPSLVQLRRWFLRACWPPGCRRAAPHGWIRRPYCAKG